MKKSAKNKAVAFLSFVVLPSIGFAAGKVQSNPIWVWILNNLIFIIAGLVFVGAVISLFSLLNAVLVAKSRELLRAKGIEVDTTPDISEETFLSKWYTWASGLVPIDKEADLELDHDYDGIKELDNSLPPWWLYGFYLSIVIGIAYLYVYHYSDIGMSQHEEYVAEMREGEKVKAAFAARQANNIDEKNLVALLDEQSLRLGMDEFTRVCAACHGKEGQGGVGPNLTDKYWLHGGSMPEIYKTIKNGVPEKGMIAWKNQMQPVTMHQIASYIETLQGTNPPNPKEKQGLLYEKPIIEDTTIIEVINN